MFLCEIGSSTYPSIHITLHLPHQIIDFGHEYYLKCPKYLTNNYEIEIQTEILLSVRIYFVTQCGHSLVI